VIGNTGQVNRVCQPVLVLRAEPAPRSHRSDRLNGSTQHGCANCFLGKTWVSVGPWLFSLRPIMCPRSKVLWRFSANLGTKTPNFDTRGNIFGPE